MAAIASWTGVNAVGFPLNEDCWLGINGIKPALSGANYINFIKSEVAAAEAHGLYPVVWLMDYAPGTTLAANENDPMPDNDHSPAFWKSVANTFKGDPNIIFRLLEEPTPNVNGLDSLQSWQCWSQGDVQYGTNGSVTSQVNHCHTSYTTVGMQGLVNIIRATGATNVIQLPGIAFANLLACSTTGNPNQCGILDSADGVRVQDTLKPAQLMADVDVYPDANGCGNLTCYNDTMGPVAAVMPIDAGETAPGSCSQNGCDSTTKEDQFLDWMDQHQGNYYAWAWDTWSSLITSYSGTPRSPFGADYKARLAGG